MASASRRVNRICAIEARGRRWESKSEIEEIIHFFKQHYTSDKHIRQGLDGAPFNRLSFASESSIEAPFSTDTTKSAVFGMGGDHAPGPDGFPMIFFSTFLEFVEG